MSENKYIDAYNTMMEHLHEDLGDASRTLARALDAAKEKVSEIGGLTQEEIHNISEYLKRDIEDAAQFLADHSQDSTHEEPPQDTATEEVPGDSLSEWLKFDIELIENFALDAFMGVADKTRLELAKLEQLARQNITYQTSEITGPGTLVCNQCNETIDFKTTSIIPECPKCSGKIFQRT